MRADLVNDIYEAALVPELWPDLLDALVAASGSASGAVIVYETGALPRWTATDLVREAVASFCATDAWRRSERVREVLRQHPASFAFDVDYLSPTQFARDPAKASKDSLGIALQFGTVIPMPTGELVGITFERRRGEGRHDPEAVALLGGLRPHLARAGLLATRLGLERARAAVATLEAVGLPAAALSASGRVLAVNGSFEATGSVFRPAAQGGLALASPAADALLREALAQSARQESPATRSFPVPAAGDRPALVVHVLPIAGAAQDIFSGSASLVVATAIGASELAPTPLFLHALFDLTPAEARIAIGLAAGRSLKEVAAEGGIRFGTARSYLEQVFRKTGTRQQSQLVALVKSAKPLGGAPAV